jgi:hypothetical protein
VYIYNTSSQVLALDARTGTTVWTGPNQAASPGWSAFQVPAAPASPLVAGRAVYATGVDGSISTPPTTTALSAATGSVLWSVPGQSVIGLAGSALYTADGGYLYARNPSTGAVMWEYPGLVSGHVIAGAGNLYAVTNTSDVAALHLPPDSLP